MKTIRILAIILILLFLLVGCNRSVFREKEYRPMVPSEISINGSTLSIEEINTEILTMFNNELYYHKDGLFRDFLNKQIEYELFFVPGSASSPQVYLIITNQNHPLSAEDSPKLCKIGIGLSINGLQTTFNEWSYVARSDDVSAYLVEGGTYLGSHTALISNVSMPVHEEMSEQWKLRAEAALQRYMDENDFYYDDQMNLPEGNYDVYIKGFSESDTDSIVIFAHEDGRVYEGIYYFVHDISDGETADLNHVESVGDIDPSFMEYLEKIQQHAALHMNYAVH